MHLNLNTVVFVWQVQVLWNMCVRECVRVCMRAYVRACHTYSHPHLSRDRVRSFGHLR